MKLAPIILLLFFVCSGLSQTSLRSGPKVNGIGLGATREEVIKKLGKPTSQSKKNAGDCVGGFEMMLRYPGLKITLWDDTEDPKKFTVGMFEVSSPKWDVSGARIGQSDTETKKKFGTRNFEGKDDSTRLPFWSYEMDEDEAPGNTTFTFRSGKLVRISSMWLMC